MRVETITESQEASILLTDRQAEALENLGRRLASQRDWWGEEKPADRSVIRCRRISDGVWAVLVREAVGAISVEDVQITVLPKIPFSHFMFLAARSGVLPRIDDAPVTIAAGKDLWNLVAAWYISAAEALLRRELAKGYVDEVDDLDAIRGRIFPRDTALAYYQGARRVRCEFEEFSEDTALNRVLKAAAEIVASGAPFDSQLRKRAKGVLARMGAVGGLEFRDASVQVDRLTQHYQSALSFARYLISRCGVQVVQGRHLGWSFLIRTPEIVESGVRETLAMNLTPEWAVAKRRIRLGRSRVTLNPDLVIGDGLVTADVKYTLAQPDWSRQHLYQAVAFATGFGAHAAAVIGFRIAPSDRAPESLQVGDVFVKNFYWEANPEVKPEAAGPKLSAELSSWIRTLPAHDVT